MMKYDPIPFLDLVTPHCELEDELLEVARQAFRGAGFIGGRMLEEFETAFAQYCETRFCVGASSGTDALLFALIAAGVCRGDAVVTVPNTFIATAEAISQAGALPEFVDIDERTYNMDPEKLRDYIENHCVVDHNTGGLISRRSGKRVAAIVPVHLFGQMADMDPIFELAELYGLAVIEDACQAHGAEYFSHRQNRWFKAGSMGHAAAFSFYPGKNLGACGDAGAITTNNESIARISRQLRDHGQVQKYCHNIEGYNGRLDAIQAGFLNVKLQYLTGWTQGRRQAAWRYRQLLHGTNLTSSPAAMEDSAIGNRAGVILPHEPEWARPVYHLFVVRVADRTRLMEDLAEEHIGTAIHYPVPLHRQQAYAHLTYAPGTFPVTEKVAEEIVSLPMFPHLAAEQQARVRDAVLRSVQQRASAFAATGNP
jgi:dTDP-4-amino-4,6-dideoxygalactose transaminase